LRLNYAITGINELPREINKSKLEDIDSDKEKQLAFYRDIRYRFSGVDENNVTVFILTYSNREKNGRNREPSAIETEYLCGLLNHPLNDIWVPPIVPQLKGLSYVSYLKEFYNQARSYPKIALTGLIPHIARLEIRHLRDLFLKEGVNYFVMDFDGKNPLDMVGNINQAVGIIDYIERETGNPCFLHGINVPITKGRWSKQAIPAKDILLFEMGFNCFGSNHVKRQLPPEIVQKMGLTTKRPFRVFSRKDYLYYRDDTHGLRDIVSEERPTAISLNDFSQGLTWGQIGLMEKLFSVERHGIEADVLRTKLIERESVASYIQSKSKVPGEYVRKVLDMKRPPSLD